MAFLGASLSLKDGKINHDKKILIAGTLMILVAAMAGSQFFTEGKAHFEKVEVLRSKGYEMM